MHDTVIPRGYRFIFNFENKHGSLYSRVKEGVSERHAIFFVKLAEALKTSWILDVVNCIPEEKSIKNAHKDLFPIFEEFKDLFKKEEVEKFKFYLNDMTNYISKEILFHSENTNHLMYKLTNYEVQYVEKDIILKNVKDKFK